jgi:hypothetical protein
MTRWIFGAILVAAVTACSDGRAPESTQVGGGSTEDFNGNGMPCTHVVPVPLDDEDVEFAAAVAQVRALIEGDYSVPIVWVDPCSSAFECGRAGTCEGDAGTDFTPADLVGTETILHVSVHSTGDDAIVLDDQDTSLDGNENEMESQCAEELRIPAIVTLTSDDGALDEEFAVDIWSEDPDSALINFEDGYAASTLEGNLSQSLPPGSSVQFHLSTWMAGAEGTRYSQGIYVSSGDVPFLHALSSDANNCAQELARDSVLD